MKFIFALIVLATSVASIAAERSIYDIMYLPSAGTAFGRSDASAQFDNIEESDGGDKNDINTYAFTQAVGYSVTESFLLSASANWTEAVSEYAGQSRIYTKGLSDPTISGKFRLIDDAYIFDVLADYSVSTGNKEQNTGLTRSNNKAGGSDVSVGGQFGQKSSDFQWAILGQFTRSMEKTWDIGGTDQDVDAHNSYLMGATFLSKISDISFFKASVSLNFVDGFDVGDTANASVTTASLFGEYHYLLSQNMLVRAGAGFANNITDNNKQNHTWTLNIGATYQF